MMRIKVAVMTGMLALGMTLSPGPALAKNQPPSPSSSSSTSANSSKEAVPQLLSSRELAEISKSAEEPGDEVVGGSLSNLHLTYIVIALAAVVLVLLVRK